MGFDRDIALFLISTDSEVAQDARDKFSSQLDDTPAAAATVNQLIAALQRETMQLALDVELEPHFADERRADAALDAWDVAPLVDGETTKESYAEQKRVLASRLARLNEAIGAAAAACELDGLLDALDVFEAVRAPSLLMRPVASAAFAKLHQLSEAERRARIGMDGDSYAKLPLLNEITLARTAWAVAKASGGPGALASEQLPSPAGGVDPFAWPTDPEPASETK